MARGDQLARQWRILQSLIASRRGKSAADLARELEYHWRTVYRDLEALQLAGFPIFTDRVDGKNLWSVLDSARQNVPILDRTVFADPETGQIGGKVDQRPQQIRVVG